MALTNTSDLKARNVKVRQEDNTTAALLETDINNFLKGLTEEVILDIQTHVVATNLFVAFIFYTE
jgi:hypothetical protein